MMNLGRSKNRKKEKKLSCFSSAITFCMCLSTSWKFLLFFFSPLENQYPLKIHFFSRSRLDIDKRNTEFLCFCYICPWKKPSSSHFWLWAGGTKAKSRVNFFSIRFLPCGFENMTIDSEFHRMSLYVSLLFSCFKAKMRWKKKKKRRFFG